MNRLKINSVGEQGYAIDARKWLIGESAKIKMQESIKKNTMLEFCWEKSKWKEDSNRNRWKKIMQEGIMEKGHRNK